MLHEEVQLLFQRDVPVEVAEAVGRAVVTPVVVLEGLIRERGDDERVSARIMNVLAPLHDGAVYRIIGYILE